LRQEAFEARLVSCDAIAAIYYARRLEENDVLTAQ